MILAVTGGFRTLNGMASAIESKTCDMVGMARPVSAEPHLPADLLLGKTLSSKETKLPPVYIIQNFAANTQIVQMGKGEPVTDFAVQEVCLVD